MTITTTGSSRWRADSTKRRAVATRWFPSEGGTADPFRLRLYCLPHAGAGASAYRAWGGRLGDGIEVVPVQLPGREARFTEEPATTADEIADGICAALADRGDQHWALFGHSMGALIAYEVAHRMSAANRPPAHLVVSGMTAPPLAARRGRPVAGARGDAELIDRIRALGGTPDDVLRSAEMMELLLPVFRADYQVCDGYRFTPRPPLSVPVTALGGAADPGVPITGLTGWRDLTTAGYAMRVFPGGHFYLNDRIGDVLPVVRAACMGEAPHLGSCPPRGSRPGR
ncbi:thioesterase II family protein [Streptomyces afghaniensis]|uniref:thioesterase II family protein n=1 Tax=Streptomyces afghaniensis TaxID=66865 RepID=UPI0027890372|nr:alpha/beta fold hydrolase [Streptomyces afghaniensis]MDQ1020031.1 surfactin synthase thioesterase subunit [Streptomyces afghaniensis]